MNELGELERIKVGRKLEERKKERKEGLERELTRLALAQEVGRRKKLRALWLEEGDSNTIFL